MPLLRPLPPFLRPAALGAAGLLLAAVAGAQAPASVLQAPPVEGSAPALAVPATLPDIRMPELRDIQLAVPRPVRAAQAMMGMGKQRLALVLGLGQVGRRSVVDSAPRNAQAVASALRSGGFVVMLREDLGAADLRAVLKEFRDRLQPGSVGFIYVTALGAQVEGHNLLLARDSALDAPASATTPALAQRLRQTAVPLDELSDALIGSPDSLRLLVVDAAWQHPALAALPRAGLAQPRLPHGLMALFSHALDGVQEVPAVAPLPLPAPTAAAEIAATPFVRTLVGALLKPRINGPEALRSTRRAIVEATLGQSSPWLGGDTDDKEELAEATLLDGLVPRTPEEMAREALRQGSRALTRPAARAAGEQTVAEVLAQAGPAPASPMTLVAEPAPARPGPETPGSRLGSGLSSTVSALGTAAGVVATVAGAGAAAQAAVTASVATTTATTALGVAGSATSALGSTAVALAARAGSSSSGGAAAAGAVAAPATATVAPALAVAAVATAPTGAAIAATSAAALPAAPAAPAAVAAAAPAPAEAPSASTGPAQRGAEAAAALTEALPGTQRSADAGPATAAAVRAVPRRNAYGYTEGDRFSYQVVDTWADEVVGEYTTAIDEVLANGQLRANGQQLQMDPQGRPTRLARPDGGHSTFEPYQDLWWAQPQGGERRAVKFIEKFQRADLMRGETEWRGGSLVARATTISTPAGNFEVLPIESAGTWSETLANGVRSNGQWSRTVYYSKELRHPVAIDVRDADALGRPLRRERIQLLHAQQAGGVP